MIENLGGIYTYIQTTHICVVKYAFFFEICTKIYFQCANNKLTQNECCNNR